MARDLSWLDDALAGAIASRKRQAPDVLPGIYVSEHEIDALLRRPALEWQQGPVSLPARWSNPRLALLEERCDLSAFEQATLLLALGAALDQRYCRIYAYLQDDLTHPYATPGLALQLLAPDLEAGLQLRSRFEPGAQLRALDLIRLAGDETQPLISRALSIPEHVVAYLGGQDDRQPQEGAQRELVLSQPALDKLEQVGAAWQQAEPGALPVLFIAGEAGSGRRLIAQRLAAAAGRRLLTVTDGSPRHARDAALADAALCVADADRLFETDGLEERRRLEDALAYTRLPLVFTLSHRPQLPLRFAGRRTRLLTLPPPGTEERGIIWQQEAALVGVALNPQEAQLLATTYRLSGRDIVTAVEHARLPDGSEESVLERLAPAAKVVASANLGRLGQEIAPRFRWQDIVLPEEVSELLGEIIIRVRHRPLVFGEWGFTARHARSHSLSALFAGPSGTGKTMAAEVIANELGLPLYRVDLSAVVSKYIGETEKNLSQIFNEASSSSAVLFFDEADALFGKRSEVRDAHDRYANIEVSYLLQRMEDYDGIIILASNLRQNLDEAFVRRLHLTADFPFPDEAARLEIWRRNLPPSLPLGDDVDLPTLAQRFRLSGGNIRNACVTAAFLAAAEATPAGMSHLLRAVRREHQKMGKLLLSEEEAPQ